MDYVAKRAAEGLPPLLTPDPGERAPDFELVSDDGSTVRLSRLTGHRVLLFFYPSAGSPGCTKQLCEIRDSSRELTAGGTVLLGISPDTQRKVANFRAKHGLGFTLLADSEHEVAERYGVWAEKSIFGRRMMGVVRSTFDIDPAGIIARTHIGVPTSGHADALLADLSDRGRTKE